MTSTLFGCSRRSLHGLRRPPLQDLRRQDLQLPGRRQVPAGVRLPRAQLLHPRGQRLPEQGQIVNPHEEGGAEGGRRSRQPWPAAEGEGGRPAHPTALQARGAAQDREERRVRPCHPPQRGEGAVEREELLGGDGSGALQEQAVRAVRELQLERPGRLQAAEGWGGEGHGGAGLREFLVRRAEGQVPEAG